MTTPFAYSLPKNLKVDKELVEKIGHQTMEEHSITGWKIVWNNTKNTIGMCHYRKKTVFLSEFCFNTMKDKRDMVDTVLHEIAHIMAQGDGHGIKWAMACRKVGANVERCKSNSRFEDKHGDFKYSLFCKVHGYSHGLSRLPKIERSCAKCSNYYNPEHKLEVVKNW